LEIKQTKKSACYSVSRPVGRSGMQALSSERKHITSEDSRHMPGRGQTIYRRLPWRNSNYVKILLSHSMPLMEAAIIAIPPEITKYERITLIIVAPPFLLIVFQITAQSLLLSRV